MSGKNGDLPDKPPSYADICFEKGKHAKIYPGMPEDRSDENGKFKENEPEKNELKYNCATNDISLFIKAVDFAARRHRNQRRKDPAQTPYINHPIGEDFIHLVFSLIKIPLQLVFFCITNGSNQVAKNL